MSEKDFSKLRPFDLEAAKAGDLIIGKDGDHHKWSYVAGPDADQKFILRIEINQPNNGTFTYPTTTGLLRMAPLAWVRASATDPTLWPVYKGDVLWTQDGKPTKLVIDGVAEFTNEPSLLANGVVGIGWYISCMTWAPPVEYATNLLLTTNNKAPEIGEKWPGLPATYGGISLSREGTHMVHLIVWDEAPSKCMTYEDAVAAAEKINPAMESHLPTRHQGIDLFDRLHHLFNHGHWYRLLEKTKSGKSAFVQIFDNGNQTTVFPSFEGRICAVSEIPL